MHLMVLTQIRRTLFPEDEFHIILAAKQLEEIARSKRAEAFFDRVYTSDQWSYGPKMSHFLNPKLGIASLIGEEPEEYDDIFFWNPDWLCYYYYRLHYKAYHSDQRIHMHLFTDGIVLYNGKPRSVDFDRYHGKITEILNIWNRKRYGWATIEDIPYDMYLFRPEYMMYEESEHAIIEIPGFESAAGTRGPSLDGKTDLSALQELFSYQPVSLSEDVIFLDVARDGYVDNEAVYQIITSLRDAVGVDRLLVRAHPRVDVSIYEKLGVHTMDPSIMWEIYYLSEDLSEKMILGLNSSGQIMPYLMAGNLTKTISLDQLLSSGYLYNDSMKAMFRRLAAEGYDVSFPEDIEALVQQVVGTQLSVE